MRRLFSFLAVLPLAVTPLAALDVQDFPGDANLLVSLSPHSKSDFVFHSMLTDAAQDRAVQAAQDRKGGDRAGAEASTGVNPTVGSGKDIRGTPAAADPPGGDEGPIGATTTPEPSTMIMLATGIAAVAAAARRVRRRNPVR